MFGNNSIRPLLRDPISLAVEEMFPTIQGEGPFAGLSAFFIRLAGCNLACHFCDTQFESRVDQTDNVEDLVRRITSEYSLKQRNLVVLTGGEPLRQNPAKLIRELLATGTHTVQVETAGTVWQEDLADFHPTRLVYVCSPKTPKVHPEIAARCFNWKYIIRAGDVDLEDGLPNKGTQMANRDKIQRLFRPTWKPGQQIWLSPCDDYDEALNKVNRELARDLCMKHGYRLSLQMHKLVDAR